MSEQEQDAELGRLVREHAERKRKLVAMESQRTRFQEAFRQLASSLGNNVDPEFNLSVVRRDAANDPLSRFDLSALTSFLEEMTDLRKAVNDGEAKLRDAGLR